MPLYATGSSKYVDIAPGHLLINGQLLYVDEVFRINDDNLVGAPSSDFGDYYVYLRPNKKVMESYYQQNWEYTLKSTTAGGAAPSENPDELCIGRIEKRNVSGVTQLSVIELNRGKSLIDTKDISDGAVTSAKLATSLALTGNPTAPTPSAADNDTSIATTAFVTTALGSYQPLSSNLTTLATFTRQDYTVSGSFTADRSFDPTSTSLDEVAKVLGTLINDWIAAGMGT